MSNLKTPPVVIAALTVALLASFALLAREVCRNGEWEVQVRDLASKQGWTRASDDYRSGRVRLFVISGLLSDDKFSGTNDGPFEIWFPQGFGDDWPSRCAVETMVGHYNQEMQLQLLHEHPERSPLATNKTAKIVRP